MFNIQCACFLCIFCRATGLSVCAEGTSLCLYVGQLSELAINFSCPTLKDTPSPYKYTQTKTYVHTVCSICIRYDDCNLGLYHVIDLIHAPITDIYLNLQQYLSNTITSTHVGQHKSRLSIHAQL